MTLIIIGIVTFFNFIVLLYKAQHNRWADLAFDIFVLATLSFLFSGSLGGLTIAMVASFLTSLYLLIFPPDLEAIFGDSEPTNIPTPTATRQF